jgi:hypothetical protein
LASTPLAEMLRPMARIIPLLALVTAAVVVDRLDAAPALLRAELTRAGVPRGCRVLDAETRMLADLDRDGKPERLIRCEQKNDTEEAKDSDEHRDKPCNRVYLLYSGGGRARAALQAEYCPGPHGARGVGGDEIKISGTTLTQTKSGGSSWQWDQTCVQDLAPPRVRRSINSGDWSLCPRNVEERTRNLDGGTEKVAWSAPLCTSSSDVEEQCPDASFAGAYTSIPLTTVKQLPPPATTLPPGDARCRLALRAHGHVIRGAADPSGPADAAVTVWGLDDEKRLELYLHARDDRFVTDQPKWLPSDHVELWLSDIAYSYNEHCLPSSRVRKGMSQYVILPSKTGATRVLPFGEKRNEGVTASARWLSDGSLLVRVELGAVARQRALRGAIAVGYSDGDDGRRQKYLLASSRVRFDDARSLGRLFSADCTLDKGAQVYKPPATCAEVIQ